MKQQTINSTHLRVFLTTVNMIHNQFPYLDQEAIHRVMELKGKQFYPPAGESAHFPAVTEEICKKYLPFIPVISITGAPNHLTEHVGILELKILNHEASHGVKVDYISSLSLFPSGRMILIMQGVYLDSDGREFVVDDDSMIAGEESYAKYPHVRDLQLAMARAFLSNVPEITTAKNKLLTLLTQGVPENNN